jgi:hypothetical protein
MRGGLETLRRALAKMIAVPKIPHPDPARSAVSKIVAPGQTLAATRETALH